MEIGKCVGKGVKGDGNGLNGAGVEFVGGSRGVHLRGVRV